MIEIDELERDASLDDFFIRWTVVGTLLLSSLGSAHSYELMISDAPPDFQTDPQAENRYTFIRKVLFDRVSVERAWKNM